MKQLLAFCFVALALAGLPLTAQADHLSGGFVSFGRHGLTLADHDGGHVRFRHNSSVRFVDDHGRRFDHHDLTPGHRITAHYSHHGHDRVLSRVVVHGRTRHGDDRGHDRDRSH